MAILIDSNILLDLIAPDSAWFGWSYDALKHARRQSPLVYNVVVAAEVAYGFRAEPELDAFFDGIPAEMEAVPRGAAFHAARAHKLYRARGGARERTLPDFLIGGHALASGHSVLTRDTSGFRTYFPDIDIIAPDTHP